MNGIIADQVTQETSVMIPKKKRSGWDLSKAFPVSSEASDGDLWLRSWDKTMARLTKESVDPATWRWLLAHRLGEKRDIRHRVLAATLLLQVRVARGAPNDLAELLPLCKEIERRLRGAPDWTEVITALDSAAKEEQPERYDLARRWLAPVIGEKVTYFTNDVIDDVLRLLEGSAGAGNAKKWEPLLTHLKNLGVAKNMNAASLARKIRDLRRNAANRAGL